MEMNTKKQRKQTSRGYSENVAAAIILFVLLGQLSHLVVGGM